MVHLHALLADEAQQGGGAGLVPHLGGTGATGASVLRQPHRPLPAAGDRGDEFEAPRDDLTHALHRGGCLRPRR